MAAIFFAAVGDARFAVDLPSHREHPFNGVSSDWRIRVVGGPAPAGAWHAAPAFGAGRGRLRTMAVGKSRDPFADRRTSIHVFRRDEVLLYEGLLDKDGRAGSGPALHFFRASQSRYGRRHAYEFNLEQI